METPSACGEESGFTLRRCLLLCLPALVLGAVLRISFLAAVPQVFYGSDSNSYFSTAHQLWTEHEFAISNKRRYLYPIFLAALPALPGSPAVWTSVLQHLGGLASLVGIGWIVGQLTRWRTLWVPLVTLVAAAWPRTLWFEHEMIAEAPLLLAYVTTVALALPLNRLRTRQGLFWFIASATVLIALKPHGRPFCLMLLALAGVQVWQRQVRLGVQHYALLAVTAWVFLTGGSGSQGSWLLLSSALPLVPQEGSKWAEYREALQPVIAEAHAKLNDYAHLQGTYKKLLNSKEELGPVWKELLKDKTHYAKVTKGLAIEAILAHPFAFAGLVFRKTVLALSSTAVATINPADFWEKQEQSSEGRWKKRASEMRLLYHMEEREYDRMVAEGSKATLWFGPYVRAVTHAAAWTTYRPSAVGWPRMGLTFIGGWALLGLCTCLWPGRFYATAFVWAPPLFYYLAVFGVGDAVVRYLQPTDWCWLVVMALGGDFLLESAHLWFRRWRQAPVTVPV